MSEKTNTTTTQSLKKEEIVIHEAYNERLEKLKGDPNFQKRVEFNLNLIQKDQELAARMWAVDNKDAMTDALTELPNRRFVLTELSMLIARLERKRKETGNSETISVLFVDNDYLKDVNDGKKVLSEEGIENSGHDQGDVYLKTTASCLKIRSGDVAARFGGDEFVVLLLDTNDKGAVNVATRIKDDFKNKKDTVGLPAYTGLSIGIAQWTSETTAQELINKADLDMYKRKEELRLKNKTS